MSNGIVSFTVIDGNSKQTLGEIICDKNQTEEDQKEIKEKIAQIIESNIEKSKRMTETTETKTIFYLMNQYHILYLCVVDSDSKFGKEKNIIHEMIEDIDNQGGRKLLTKDKKLTSVAKQNINFTIEKYIRNYGDVKEPKAAEKTSDKEDDKDDDNEEEITTTSIPTDITSGRDDERKKIKQKDESSKDINVNDEIKKAFDEDKLDGAFELSSPNPLPESRFKVFKSRMKLYKKYFLYLLIATITLSIFLILSF